MPPFLKKKNYFLEQGVKSDPPATPKNTRNHKIMVLKALEKDVFFPCFPDSQISWKMTPKWSVLGVTFATIFAPFFYCGADGLFFGILNHFIWFLNILATLSATFFTQLPQ